MAKDRVSICNYCGISFKVGTAVKYCSLVCSGKAGSKIVVEQKRVIKEKLSIEYYRLPKLCKLCNKTIPFEKRLELIYCSQSCAAIVNNKIPKKKRKPKQSKQIQFKPYSTVFLNTCIVTGKLFYSQYYKKYSSEAAMKERVVYRQFCNFKFSPYMYTTLSGHDLLMKYGIYHPNNNPNGVSRDHMFSVADGWKNKVIPEIISHPVNCQLLVHLDNNRKKTTSCITLEELIGNIEKWKYPRVRE